MSLRLRRARTLARAGAAVGFGSLVYYLVLLIGQDDPFPWASLVFVGVMLAGVIASLRSIGNPYRARRLLIGATVALAMIGVVGFQSIGLLFLLAALFTAISAALTPAHPEGDIQR
jgi:Na+/melibiose symporter-like transporter